jgi:hypothetical protein
MSQYKTMQADGEEGRMARLYGRRPNASKGRECAGSFRFARYANVFGRQFRAWGSFFATNPKYSIPVAAK